MDENAPTDPNPRVAFSVQGVDGASQPNTLYECGWIWGPSDGYSYESVDITVTFWAMEPGEQQAKSTQSWDIAIYDRSELSEDPPVASVTAEQAVNSTDNPAKITYTFEDITISGDYLTVVLDAVYTDMDTVNAIIYDSTDYPSGIQITAEVSEEPISTGGITMTSDKTAQSVANGATATYELTFESNLTEATTVALTSNTVSGWNVEVSPNSLTVPASGTATATLTVTPSGSVAENEAAEVTVSATFDGGFASVVTTTTSLGGEVTNQNPVASFTVTKNGLKVDVDASASSDPDGDAMTYEWDWGDGTAKGSGKTATHTYTEAGTYTVKLTVNDGKGGTHAKSEQVVVEKATAKKTPGFEVVALLGAVGVAALLVRRRK